MVASDQEVLPSDSTLRFRERDEVEADLVAHGFVPDEVRDAPDRPGREFVFCARHPE
ncbi:MAG: cypM [Jatrophihabitans sp.]|nr:cypM [Jatrophihabitans sp.]